MNDANLAELVVKTQELRSRGEQYRSSSFQASRIKKTFRRLGATRVSDLLKVAQDIRQLKGVGAMTWIQIAEMVRPFGVGLGEDGFFPINAPPLLELVDRLSHEWRMFSSQRSDIPKSLQGAMESLRIAVGSGAVQLERSAMRSLVEQHLEGEDGGAA